MPKPTKPRPSKPVLGYTDKPTVKADFDKKKLKVVKYWTFRALKFFKLHGLIILQSSRGSFHVVFDRSVSWPRNIHVLAWLALMVEGKKLGKLPLTKYVVMQCIKESSTLRVGRKGRKGVPKPIFKFGSQNHEIRNYLRYRRMLIKLEAKLKR